MRLMETELQKTDRTTADQKKIEGTPHPLQFSKLSN